MTKITDCQKELFEVAKTTRIALAPGVPKDKSGNPDFAGTCLHAVVLLDMLLKKYLSSPAKTIARGGGCDGGGVIGLDGKKHGHYWLEVHFNTKKMKFPPFPDSRYAKTGDIKDHNTFDMQALKEFGLLCYQLGQQEAFRKEAQREKDFLDSPSKNFI